MKSFLKTVFEPVYCLLIRPLNGRNLRDFYYSVFKYKSFKLFLNNDFTTKNQEGVRIQYYYRRGVKFPHPVGMVIGSGVKFGQNCSIHQNVTLGGNIGQKGQPELGNNVLVFANAVVVGAIKIGDNVIIGANSFVNRDVPDNCIVGGVPARVIGMKEIESKSY